MSFIWCTCSLSLNSSISLAANKCVGYNSTYVYCSGKELNEIQLDISSTTHLNLSVNDIERVRADDFSNLTLLIVLDLSCDKISVIDDFCFHGLLQLNALKLTNNKITILNGKTFNGATNIGELYLDSNNLAQIPDLGRLPNLSYLEMSNNYISNVFFSSDYNSMVVLKKLAINYNKIVRIDFQNLHCVSIEILELKQNFADNLALTSRDRFFSFVNLKELHLSGNKFSEQVLQKVIFSLSNVTSLIYLYLNGVINGYSLSNDYFESLFGSRLEYLSLSHSQITTLDDNAFISLIKLIELDLKMSRITTIGKNFLSGLARLQKLNFEGGYVEDHWNIAIHTLPTSLLSLNLCGIRYIQLSSMAFYNLIRMHRLSLCNNSLKSFNSASFFSENNSLIYLNLSLNNSTGNQDDFSLLAGLEVLDLNTNFFGFTNTTKLDKLLKPLNSLRELNLNNNFLIEWRIGTKFPLMRSFSLAYNYIQLFDVSFVTIWQHRVEVDLRGNQFDCDNCSMFWFRNWMDNQGEKVILIGVEEYRCRPDAGKHRGQLYATVSIRELASECESRLSLKYIILFALAIVVIVLAITVLAGFLRKTDYWNNCFSKQRDFPGDLSPLTVGENVIYIAYADEDKDIAMQFKNWIENSDKNMEHINQYNFKAFIETRSELFGKCETEREFDGISSSRSAVIVLSVHYVRDKQRQHELCLIEDQMKHLYNERAYHCIIPIITTMDREIILKLPAKFRDAFSRTNIKWPGEGSKEKTVSEFRATLRHKLENMHAEILTSTK